MLYFHFCFKIFSSFPRGFSFAWVIYRCATKFLEDNCQFFKTKHALTMWIILLNIYPNKLKTCQHKNLHMFIIPGSALYASNKFSQPAFIKTYLFYPHFWNIVSIRYRILSWKFFFKFQHFQVAVTRFSSLYYFLMRSQIILLIFLYVVFLLFYGCFSDFLIIVFSSLIIEYLVEGLFLITWLRVGYVGVDV